MQQAEAEGQPTARALKASRILNNLQTARSAEAGGPRRFDPWVRGVWLVNRRVTHPPPPPSGVIWEGGVGSAPFGVGGGVRSTAVESWADDGALRGGGEIRARL